MKLTACTLNLWKTKRWPDRSAALETMLSRHRPDLLGVQELCQEHLPVIARALPHHDRMQQEEHGTIFWDRRKWSCEDQGAIDVGLIEGGALYWARLGSLLVATVHLDWPGLEQEKASGRNLRIEQARRVGEELGALHDGATILLADLNDCTHAVWILEDAGFTEVYSALGRKPRRTYPATEAEPGAPQVLDWIFFRGSLAPTMVDTVDILVDRIAPSDHRAVIACFDLGV